MVNPYLMFVQTVHCRLEAVPFVLEAVLPLHFRLFLTKTGILVIFNLFYVILYDNFIVICFFSDLFIEYIDTGDEA